MSNSTDLLDDAQSELKDDHRAVFEAGGPFLAAALEYRRRGWSIIPIAAGTKKPPKEFRWKQYQKKLPTEEELRTWFAGRDDLGVAVILGKASGGLACRDFDDIESYRRWKRSHPDLAKTSPTVRTARGRHVYCRVPPTAQVFRDLRPNEKGEYRGGLGHYCLLPPSQHPDGPEYEWLVPLPDGDIPFVEDVVEAGLLPGGEFPFSQGTDVTQKAQRSPTKSQVISSAAGAKIRVPGEVGMMIDEVMARTLPTGPATRRRTLLDLARKLKFRPEFAKIAATEIDFLKPYLKRWWKIAKPLTSGKHPGFHTSWQDFVFAWEEARVPYGAAMQAIYEKACSSPSSTLAVEKYGVGSLRVRLASLCRELQRTNGDKCFFLSGRTAGPLLGVSDVAAWRWLKQLTKDGIIEPVKTYRRGMRKATEYRYLAD